MKRKSSIIGILSLCLIFIIPMQVNAANYSVATEYDGLSSAIITNCVAFARYKVPSLPGGLETLQDKKNIINSSSPVVGSIAITSGNSSAGHVAYVEKVSGSQITTLNGGFCDSYGNYTGHIERITGTASELGILGYWVPSGLLSAPVNPRIEKSSIWYDIKDNITVWAEADYATGYYMSMFKDGEKLFSQEVPGGKFSMTASAYGIGEYSCYFSCYNSAGSIDTKWISFKVVGPANYSSVSVSKSKYYNSETVIFSVATVCAKGMVIGIDRCYDNSSERVWTAECNSTANYSIAASQLGVGRYSAYFSVYNGSGGVDTKRVQFYIITQNHTHNYKKEITKEASCEENGSATYTCIGCGDGYTETILAKGHEWDAGVVMEKATATKNGVIIYTCLNCKTTKTEEIKATGLIETVKPAGLTKKEGEIVQDVKSGGVYQIDVGKKSVQYVKPVNKKKAVITIPSTIVIEGISLPVTSIKANAFKNNKYLKKVIIGNNIKSIGSKAFYGCKKLKSVVIKTSKLTTKTVGSKAFKKIYKKPVISTRKKKIKSYKKILKAKGISSKAKYKKL